MLRILERSRCAAKDGFQLSRFGRRWSARALGPQRSQPGTGHPFETLEFFGLRSDWQVIEIAPGGGWYTEILAAFRDKLAADPVTYQRVVLGTLPVTRFTDIHPPGGVDAVLTFRNIHNWIADGHFDETLRAFFDVLSAAAPSRGALKL